MYRGLTTGESLSCPHGVSTTTPLLYYTPHSSYSLCSLCSKAGKAPIHILYSLRFDDRAIVNTFCYRSDCSKIAGLLTKKTNIQRAAVATSIENQTRFHKQNKTSTNKMFAPISTNLPHHFSSSPLSVSCYRPRSQSCKNKPSHKCLLYCQFHRTFVIRTLGERSA